MATKNVLWTQQVQHETVHFSNDACAAVEAFRESEEIFARRREISGEEMSAGIRAAITPVFLRDYGREPSDAECSYAFVAARRHANWDCYDDDLTAIRA